MSHSSTGLNPFKAVICNYLSYFEGILKILARFLLGVYQHCRTCTIKVIKKSWLLESHTQKISKIARTGAKLQAGVKKKFVLPKKYPLRGGQVSQFCSAKLMYHSFESHCSASLNIGQKLLNDDSKTGKN